MIPILYDQTETEFASNGIGRLTDCISCLVTEERNGVYECDFQYPVDGLNYEEIECGRIIAVTHDESEDIQPFDIVSYSKPLNGIVSFHAVHISYRQTQMVCKGTGINTITAAFNMLKTASPSNPFSYETDITTAGYMGAANGVPRTVRNMLGGVDGSILDTYGGEFEWDKWTVRLLKARGEEKDFTIRYGINLMEYRDDMDYSETYSSVIPYWYKEDKDSPAIVVGSRTSCGQDIYVDRDICIPLDLSEKFEEQPTAAQLQTEAARYMTNNPPYIPKQNLMVNFAQLQGSGEADEYEEMLRCRLCDSIRVVFPLYDVHAKFKVVKTVFNVLNSCYESLELGTLSSSLKDAMGVKK